MADPSTDTPTGRRPVETDRDRRSDGPRDGTDGPAAGNRGGTRADDEGFLTVDESGGGTEVSVDREAVRERVADLLREWEAAGILDQVRSRTRTVTAVALVVLVVSYALSGAGTGVTSTVASLWLAASGAVGLAVGAVAFLLRGVRNPEDVADTEGLVSLLGLLVLAVGTRYYARTPALRAAWRYLVTGPLPVGDRFDPTAGSAVGARGPSERGEADGRTVPIERYVRWAGGLSAAVILVHQAWLAAVTGESLLGSLFGGGADGPGGPGLGSAGLTAGEQALVLVAVVFVGGAVGALLAVRES